MKKKILLLIVVLLTVLVIVSQWDAFLFSKIHDGATRREVQGILGSPDSVTTNEAGGYVILHYKDSWPWRSSTVVCISTNGVYEIYHP